jgi:hypothetical protein
VQMTQLVDTLVAMRARGQLRGYGELVTVGLVPP